MKRKCGFRWQIYHQEELKFHLNLSWFKLYTISPKKRQFILVDTYSHEKTQPPPWKAIWDWVRVWKHLPWIFHLVGMFFSLVSIIIQFLFYFHVLHVIFIKIMAKKRNWYFLAQVRYIISAISLSWLALVIGFNNNNSINTVSFSI